MYCIKKRNDEQLPTTNTKLVGIFCPKLQLEQRILYIDTYYNERR